MDGLYTFAENIVGTARPNIHDGGLLAFLLNNLRLSALTSSNETKAITTDLSLNVSRYKPEEEKVFTASPIDHLLTTFQGCGYLVALLVGILWCILLLLMLSYFCLKHQKKKIMRDRIPGTKLEKKNFQPPAWHGIAHACFIATIQIAICVVIILGMVTTVRLHINLTTKPSYNYSLLSTKDFQNTIADSNNVFPSIVYALANVKSYLYDFLKRTRAATDGPVNELIAGTQVMQNEKSKIFQDFLSDAMNTTAMKKLSHKLTNHLYWMLDLMENLATQSGRFKIENSRLEGVVLKLADDLKDFGRGIKNCENECKRLQSVLFALDVNTTTIERNNVIAFQFVMNNITKKKIMAKETEKLKMEKDLQQKSMTKAAKRMDIPGSIRAIINAQWDELVPVLAQGMDQIDAVARNVTEDIYPKVRPISMGILISSIIIWFIMLAQVLWLAYTCIAYMLSKRPVVSPYRGYMICLILIMCSLFISMIVFLFGGYASTEVCRYLSPERSRVHVSNNITGRTQEKLALDIHIDKFVTTNWDIIKKLYAKSQEGKGSDPAPMPHIKSPIHALAEACHNDVGILEAFNAITDYDMSSMNKPETSEKFITIGREIVVESLKEMDITVMLTEEDETDMKQATKLDSFLKFEDWLANRTTLVVKNGTKEFSRHNIPIQKVKLAWDTYRVAYLQGHISEVKMDKLQKGFKEMFEQEKKVKALLEKYKKELQKLRNAEPITPTANQLAQTAVDLKKLFNDKDRLIKLATDLYKIHVEDTTAESAAGLTAKYGPNIMRAVGQCELLNTAYTAVTKGACSGIVAHLNGLWLCLGMAFLFQFISLVFVVITVGNPSRIF